jgi:hypothetical protein
MATLPPLMWYEQHTPEGQEVMFGALHGMADKGNIRERMRPEEVEDIIGHCFVIHRSCMRRRSVVAEILRREEEAFHQRRTIEQCDTH